MVFYPPKIYVMIIKNINLITDKLNNLIIDKFEFKNKNNLKYLIYYAISSSRIV